MRVSFFLVKWRIVILSVCFPRGSDGKESACNAGDLCLRAVGKIPRRRPWQPTPIFLPGESHGQRSLTGYSTWGRKESGTTEWLSTAQAHLTCIDAELMKHLPQNVAYSEYSINANKQAGLRGGPITLYICPACVPSPTLWARGLWPSRLLCPWDSAGKNTRVGCRFVLQGIFLTQGSNPSLLCLLRWQVGCLQLAPPGKP